MQKTATQNAKGHRPAVTEGHRPGLDLSGSHHRRPAETYIPRRIRGRLRANAAMARGKDLGAPMFQNVEAMIAATGGEFFRINIFKIGIENLLLRGADCARMQFGDIARALPTSFDGALIEVERTYRSEVAHVAQLSEHALGGRHHGMVLNRIDRLRNVLVILRLLRFTGHADAFQEIREAVAESIPLVDAMRSFHRSVNPAGYRR